MTTEGFTLNETKDPKKRLHKLMERRQHIEDMIAQMQDQHFIIEGEIAECHHEILKKQGFVNCSDAITCRLIWSDPYNRECPR